MEKDGRLGDGEGVRAVGLENLLSDEHVGAVDQRHDRDDGRHADDDAEQREHRAELVGPQRLQRELESFSEFHERADLVTVRMIPLKTSTAKALGCRSLAEIGSGVTLDSSRRPDDRCLASFTFARGPTFAGGGKSELRRAVCRITSGMFA